MIRALLLASLATSASVAMAQATLTRPLPAMKADDQTAQFQGDVGAVKFDPTCRNYTVRTVKSVPDCAARLERGETAPSLAIASVTLTSEPDGAKSAVTILERTIAAEDHPAAHYLMGVLLGTGQGGVPRYAQAIKHLEIASRRGNPAAADLLATLIIDGKGAPRDLPRAIALYKQAIEGGHLGSATSLAMLHLNGRYIPRDVEFGARLLEEAARLGDARAQSLAPLARSDLARNFQLFPASDPKDVKVRQFGTFDNPDIPPNFGFDDAVQALHYKPFDDAATLAQLRGLAKSGHTPYLYELARRLGPSDPIGAFRTYVLARTRMTYDTARCGNSAATAGIRAWDVLILSDIAYLIKALNVTERGQAMQAAMTEELSLPADNEPWWVCRSGPNEFADVMAQKTKALSLKPMDQWPQLREEARAKVFATFSAIR